VLTQSTSAVFHTAAKIIWLWWSVSRARA